MRIEVSDLLIRPKVGVRYQIGVCPAARVQVPS